jgi:hypothetical protein
MEDYQRRRRKDISIVQELIQLCYSVFDKMELSPEEVEDAIAELTKFCSTHSWEVIYSDKKENKYYNNTITLYKNRRAEILYYIFLHEIGHAWMLECDFTYQDRYPELTRFPLRYATVTYKIAKVQEEIEAWEVGRKLASSLGLRVNESKFEKIRAQCLLSYMNWAGRPRKRKPYGTQSDITKNIKSAIKTT